MRTQSSSIRALSVALFLAASMVFQTVPLMGATRIAPPGSVLNGRAGRNVASAPQPQPAAPEVKANGSRTSFESFVSKDDRPLIPLAPTITATLTDNVSLATKIAPGAIVNYVATITNSGASPANDATNLTYNATLDANTTLVPGSIHASPVAFNDTYNWIGNTVLDTNARSLPAVSANDVAVNATGGGDTFNVTPIAGGATTLGGTVTLLASGHYTYTPPLNRPTAIDGASVNDSFTYTITNSVDPALTSTGTVTITLTGRVFYLQQGATGDGRSANPSGNPGTMSTNADKPTDIFYIFSSGSSLVGLFTVDAGQQLLGSGVNLVVNIPTLGAVTLFTGTAPTPAINNGVGNCVTLAGAPGNNTLSGFNISTCNGFGIQGANVGTLAISTLSINNTIGGGLDLTGVGAPSVNIVLGGLTSTGGAKNVNLVGLNGTINLAGGALSSATGNGFDVNGGTAAITYTGSISNSGGKQVSVANKTGGSASFSGAISGTGTGINLTTNTGATIGFSGGMTLSTSTNAAFTATGGGTVNVSGTNNITTTSGAGINWNGDTSGSTVTFNNVTSTTGGAVSITSSGATDFTFNDVTATTGTAVGVTTATGDFIFHAVNANGAAKGIAVSSATGTFTVNGTATTDASGGTIQNCTAKGAEFISSNNITLKNMDFTNNGTAQTVAGSASTCGADLVGGNNLQCVSQVHLQTVTTVSLSNLNVTGGDQMGINGNAVSGFSLANSNVTGNGNESFENGLTFQNLTGTCSITDTIIRDNFAYQLNVTNIANSSTLTLGITGTRTNNAYPTQDTSTTMIGRTAVPVASQAGILFNSTATATNVNATLNLTGVVFNNNYPGNAVLLNPIAGSGSFGGTTTNCSFDRNAGGVIIQAQNGQSSTYNITNTEFYQSDLQSILYSALNPFNSTLIGTVQGNIIGSAANAGSACTPGGSNCTGIDVNFIGGSGAIQAKIGGTSGGQGNTIQQFDGNGIRVVANGSSNPSVQVAIQNNTIQNPFNLVAHGIDMNIGTTAGANVIGCLNITSNTVTGTYEDPGVGQLALHTRVRFLSEHRLPGMSGTGAANAETFLNTNNPGIGGLARIFSEGNGVPGYQSGAACTTPLLLATGGIESLLNSESLLAPLALPGLGNFVVLSRPCHPAEAKHSLIAGSSVITTSLSQQQLDSIVSAAIRRWSVTGLTSQQVTALRGIKFEIADLKDAYLGEADSNHVLVDTSAQGRGWFVDANPMFDSSFARTVSDTRLYTDPMNAAAGRVDLLTAIEHEVGHRLGLDDSYLEQDRESIMYGYLTVGERRLPARGQAQYGVVGKDIHKHFLQLGSELAIQTPKTENVNTPQSGENVSLNTIAVFPAAGKSITIKFSATVNTPPSARSVSTQGTVSATNPGFVNVLTTDPETGTVVPTVTLVNTLMTWNGATNTDWNTATNWTPPAGGTQYSPGVSNPAVNDAVIPNVGNQPSISATDIGIYSLSLANGRTLTITNPRVLTIGGSPGGDLTLDGIISGGFLNLGTGTHAINNAGGTGSLSATNVATVLSGGTVTLNNNLQAGALAVNAGGSMNITNRTLSLNGSGAALTVPGGATFTTTGSTVIFNGTAAQQAAGVAYNNLTINNAIGANVTGVTLIGNATVNGALALTSSDLATGAFVLSQPNTTASTGVSDVVGTITRTAAFGTTTITFGNPNNQITFGAAGTKPTALTVALAKVAPATYAAAVQRNYTISQTGTNTATATVRLHYLDSELNGNTPETSLGLRRLRTGDGHWVAAPPPPGVPTRDGAANWIEAPGVSGTDLPTQWTFSTLAPTASGGTVTGRIVDDHGLPVEGAVVRLQGAQNRKFITDANGFYRFENVPTAGFYTVTPSRANYSFNPATRSFSQLGDSTEAGFGATLAASNFENPLDTPEYFVRQHYLDFLGREPDEVGFNFWSDQILECGGDQQCISRRRENVSAAYFLSIEFQKTGGLVAGLYRAGYGVAPQYSSFMPDTRTVGLGVRVGMDGWEAVLRANTEAFVNSFVNRPAFHQMYDGMADSLFVDTLIGHTGVSFTAAERDALVSGLGTAQMTRAEALRSIAENSRFVNAKFNETFVMMEYMGYLRRDPDAGGFAFWLNKLNEFNGNFEQAEMVKAFMVSGEYRDRFPR